MLFGNQNVKNFKFHSSEQEEAKVFLVENYQ